MFGELNLESVMKYVTPETMTVLIVGLSLYAGFRTTRWLWGLGVGAIRNFSFAGIAAAVLATFGLGTAGVGGGELVSRMVDGSPKEQHVSTGMNDATIAKIGETVKDPETAKLLINYVQVRDKANKNGNVEMEQLISFAASAKPEQKESVLALIKLQQTKEESKSSSATSPITVEANVPAVPVTVNPPEKTFKIPFFANGDRQNSYFSIQGAFAMVAIGIGSLICGLNIYKNRPMNLPINNAYAHR